MALNDPDAYICEQDQMIRLMNVKTALYHPDALTPDQRRDLAHKLGLVITAMEGLPYVHETQ